MISGINHVTLSVQNLEESFDFYTKVLNLKPLAKRKGVSAYLLAGEDWIALVEEKEVPRPITDSYSHLAFSIDETNFLDISERINNLGIKIWQNNTSPGDSIYFLDPSGNKLEIHSSNWKERIRLMKQELQEGIEIFEDQKT